MDEEIERLVVSVRADTGAFARDVADMRGQLDGPLAAGADRAGRAIEAGLLRAVRTGKLGFEDLRRIALSVLAEIAEAAVRAGIGAIGTIGRGGGGSGGGGGQGGGGHGGLLTSLAGMIGGLAGRATGGPVGPGTAYLVGERGPELFVPTASGRVETGAIVTRQGRGEHGAGAAVATDRSAGGTADAPVARRAREPVWIEHDPKHGAPAPPPAAPAPATYGGTVLSAPVVAAVREIRVAITVNARGGEAPAALARSSRQVARAVRSALGSID